ncbi:MAG: D-galactarate dehydratase [Chloroflexi bacterium]|nr:MAG: D-galactarate dehydratase [Chloroflexota bacterium]
MSFLGYQRPDGSVGIRNYVLVLPGGLLSSKVCEFVVGARTIVTADIGAGRTKRDRETIARILVGLGRNPNVAGVIAHDVSASADYPELNMEKLTNQIAESKKPVEFLSHRKYPDNLQLMEKAIRVARQMVRDASRARRELVDDSNLSIAVKCGRSDTTSGVAGNPVMGYLFDRVVDAGGTALFGETTEIIGAEHIIAQRAVTKEVSQALIDAAHTVEERAKKSGEDIRTINPIPANIAGGITTLEEKSLGAIRKAGTRPIQGVLKYGEIPKSKGLYFVDNWMAPMSIFPGYAAAGSTLLFYQAGGGGMLYDTLLGPSPAVVAPLAWTTANHRTYQAAGESVDFYSGTVIEGKESIEEAGERLFSLVQDIASGTMTKVETINYADPVQMYLLDIPY